MDYLYVLPFDAEMAELSDRDFARRVLAQSSGVDATNSEGLGARHVSAGFDVTFGKDRTGSPEALIAYGRRFGFGVSIVEAVADPEGSKCSSSAIRLALAEGRPEQAAELLGRPFAIEGVVVEGDKLGRTIGFPTANIALEEYVLPAAGIYAARTRLADGREVPGVAYIGRRPTVNGVEEKLEVHLLDFDEDLYGQTLEVDLVAFLRGDEHFDTLEAMVDQMRRDAAEGRRRLMPDF